MTLPSPDPKPKSVKWRCGYADCRAAFQEPRLFHLRGHTEIHMMCHRCKRVTAIVIGKLNS